MPLAKAAVSDWGKIKRLNLYYNGCSACMSVSYPLQDTLINLDKN